MISSLVLLALAPDPWAQSFWARDLPSLVRRLVDAEGDPGAQEPRALWGDLVRLVNCEPLPDLEPSAPAYLLRALVRVEEARRRRLGPDAPGSATIWRDILDPSFFQRGEPSGSQDGVLLWPVEPERWPSERTLARVRPSTCRIAESSGSELEVLTADLVNRFEGNAEQSTLAYHRALRLWARGADAEAQVAARRIDVNALDPDLAAHARLLRLDLGVDPEEGYLALLDAEFPLPTRLWVALRATAVRASQNRWRDVAAITARALEGLPPEPSGLDPLVRHLTWSKALAHRNLGEPDALRGLLRAALPRWADSADPVVDALRELALEELAAQPFDDDALAQVRAMGPEKTFGERLRALGSRALERGANSVARAVAGALASDALPRHRVRGLALLAERAVLLRERAELERAIHRIIELRERAPAGSRDRDEVEQAAADLAEVLVTRGGTLDGRWRKHLARELQRLGEHLHSRRERLLSPLLVALRDAPLETARPAARGSESWVAVGVVPVGAPRSSPPAPQFRSPHPEPFSLLAIPTSSGELRPWFELPAAAPVSEVPHAR